MVKLKKVLAMFLVFTMTFSNFAFVAKSFASTGFESIFGVSAMANHEDVEFEAYLASENEDKTSLVSDVNNENLALKLNLQVQKGGYLKNGKIEIKAKEEETLNFAIKPENDVTDLPMVQSLENNVLTLNKIENASDKVEILLPIEYEMEEYIKETKLNSKTMVVLSGTYIDNEGAEHELTKEVELQLSWKDERQAKVEDTVSKYIRFGESGVILQTVVKVDSSSENKNSLPIKETNVNVEVPTIQQMLPTDITVEANSTAGTNGKGVGETEFSQDNWNYDVNQKCLNIKVENKKELVDVSKDEFLKIEGEDQKQEERYYSVAGVDEFLITYSFQNVEMMDEMKVVSKAEAKVIMLNDNQEEIKADTEEESILTEQTGNIVSYNIENETKDVSKIYGYLDKENEYISKTAINISYQDIVEEIIVEDVDNYYMDKAGNKVLADDMYYKQISVAKENFHKILGDDGNIQILDQNENGLITINKDMQTDENGNYVVYFENPVSKIAVKTSHPVSVGNLVITNIKAVSKVAMAKSDYANMEYIASDTKQKAKFTYVSDYADLGTCTTKTRLNDTTTDFNLKVDKDNFSTVTTNSNVEMRLELNNDETTSDIYGNSTFEIEMPEYVTGLNVTNASVLYGEGLEISNVRTYEKNGKPVIKVDMQGKQTDLNSGVLTNGTNIVLNADVDVDMYAPLQNTKVKAYCYNSEATNYANPVEYNMESSNVNGYKEAEIEYSAPYGMISINTISNYAEGKQVTSVKQGSQTDYIDIYAEAKKAKMEIAVVNNNETQASSVAILGRVPFEGVKDIETGEDLGTTITAKMVSQIIANEANNGKFVVYYSENEKATKDLSNVQNGWNTNPENLENVKSYLIVPEDSNFVLEPKQVLRFTYEFEIPENLEHNENIYGTFATYYKEESVEGISKPDKVGLTTGAGPELNLEMKTDVKSVRALDEMKATITVKNTGADAAQNVVVKVPVPSNTTFISAKADKAEVNTTLVDNVIVCTVEELQKNAEVQIEVKLAANSIIEENSKVELTATATAKDLKKELTEKLDDVMIKKSEIAIKQYMHYDYPEEMFKTGRPLPFIIEVQNLTNDVQNNVKVVSTLPEEIDFSNGSVYLGEDATYDSNSRKVTWHISQLKSGESAGLYFNVVVGELPGGITGKSVKIVTEVSADKTDTYKAQDMTVNIGKSSISVTQNSATSTYVQEGEIIDYTFTIKNEGAADATNVLLRDVVPSGLVIRKMSYSLDGEEFENNMSETQVAEMALTIPAETEIDVNVQAIASNLGGEREKSVTNEGKISSANIDEVVSNSVTHIIQAEENEEEEEGTSSNNGVTSSETNNNRNDITKTYKISGLAWLDANENGMREDAENRMPNITAMLVDSSSGMIKGTTTTNSRGEYTFSGVQNGSYLVLFKYDTVLYTTTTYRKEGIESNINSDAVTTKIEQDGREENGAVTDVINVNGANVSNIDIGFVEAQKFSLALDKSITKITVQNSQGTQKEEFDHVKLAQYGIRAKYLAGTDVYIEYTFKVTNNGDVAGYASEIVDYLPQGMTFNSNLNGDWYTGTDGNLYTKALADTELKVGESKELKLVLTKKMNTENTGNVSNTAEISKDFNIYGISDHNSKPANKAQGEDDMSTADMIITVSTGETLIYTSVIIMSLLIGCAVTFGVYGIVKSKRKGGV